MVMRTYGLSGSGMDIDSLVKDMMKARRASYDTMYKTRTQLEWKKADYNNIYTSINSFRSNTVLNYKLEGTLAPKNASSSNEAVATAKANADAAAVNHTLVVGNLASGVTKTSSGAITTGSTKDTLVDQFGIAADPFDIKITNGTQSKVITVDPTKSIYEFVAQINAAGVNVKANYDATLDRFFMYTTNTGAAAGISFADSSAAGINFLGTNLKLNTVAATGADANITLDGVGLSQASNTFTVSGVTYTLKADGAANINVVADNDKAMASVKAFVEEYNKILSQINGELGEAKYKSYLPLTSEQKKEMKESEITEWEKLAKSGLLKGDPILRDAVVRMRADLSAPISGLTGKYTSAAAIGITTGTYSEGGKLYLDESKLRTALEEDPDAVKKLFGTDAATAGADGIAVRLYDTLQVVSDHLSKQAGVTASSLYDTTSNLGKQINDYNKRMDALNERLKQEEDRYYRQFDAMEAAIQRLNQQSAWLAQQVAGGQ